MCGILFIVSDNQERTEVLEESLLPLLHHRGPDAQCTYSIKNGGDNSDGDVTEYAVLKLSFHGTVLKLRGELTQQPLVNEEGCILLWNGEIFGGDVEVAENANDTTALFEKLQILPFQSEDGYQDNMISLLASIQGPWAFIFYDPFNKYLWYGRDYLGRRSLMSSFQDHTFCLSSLGHRSFTDNFTEVPAKMLYCLNINSLFKDEITDSIISYPMELNTENIIATPRNCYTEHRCLNEKQFEKLDDIEVNGNQDIICGNIDHNIVDLKDKICNLTTNSSVGSYINTQCKSANQNHSKQDVEPNSCTTTHEELPVLQTVDEKQNNQIGIINCCHCMFLDTYGNTDAYSDTQKNISCDSFKCSNSSKREVSSLILQDIPIEISCSLLSIIDIRNQFLCVLEEAVRRRVSNLPRILCKNNTYNDAGKVSKVGILFSGGIDSVVLTALADRCTPPWESIDLINVAFAQKQKVQQNVKKKYQRPPVCETLNFDVPDRITGRTALKELPKLRKWNFVEVDVTLEELQEQRKCRITNLVYPLDSVLDDSIGCAIWFAARGVGRCYTLSEDGELQLSQENYESPVKVLLTGMGADEQLGGYARHRTKFESSGWAGLQSEMEMEIGRISSRNLGRDDRCISDHGREARFPFLDENVVSYLQKVPVCVKCDPRLPRGLGEKILLREVALSLGLTYASKLPKRAIQFGSKIAKLESNKEKGSDNCKRLENIEI